MRVYDNGSPNGVCSACFNAKPGMVHVDFESAWDGPVFRDALPDGTTLTIPVQIDDLILCADCIQEAASHVPDTRDPQMAKLRAQHMLDEQRIGELEERIAKLQGALVDEFSVESEPRARARKSKAPA